MATLLCLVFDPIVEGHLYYLWYVLGLVFTAWYGGFRPCLTALVLSLPLIAFTFAPPRFNFAIEGTGNQLGFLAYCFVGTALLLYSTKLVEGVRKVVEANALLAEKLPSRLAKMEQELTTHITDAHEKERRLAASYEVTFILSRSENLACAASRILQTVCENLEWDVGLFWELDRDALDQRDELLRCVQVWHRPEIEVTRFVEVSRQTAFPRGTGLPGRVWATGLPIALADMMDANLPRSCIAGSMGLHGAVGFPVRNGTELLGVMEFFSREIGNPDNGVVQMMACIGGQIIQFVERRDAERVLVQERHDRRTARSIQQGLLPKAMPKLAGFQISGKAAFAQDVGGDCFDFVPMCRECEGCLAVLIADASGHGMASALLVGETRAYVRALALTCSDLSQILAFTNSHLASGPCSDHFVTLLLARLDPRTHSLTYANAGHCPGYVLDTQGQIRAVLGSLSIPLGIDGAGEFPTSPPVPLHPGELVLLYSDGIPEAQSPEGRQFGAELMLDIVQTHRNEPLEVILDSLFRAASDFAHRSIPQDDITAVLIRVDSGV
jgi:serine phosphatase RsbU (regulator of sigma subunit)